MPKKEIWIQRRPGKIERFLDKMARAERWLADKGVFFWQRGPKDPSDPGGYRRFYEELIAIRAGLEKLGFTQDAESVTQIIRMTGGGMPSDWFEEAITRLEPILRDRGPVLPAELKEQIQSMVDACRRVF